MDHCLDQLKQRYNQKNQIQSIQIQQNKKHHIVLLGKSGQGKTTIFKTLCQGNNDLIEKETKEFYIGTCIYDNNLTIMDTPPFNLQHKQDQQKILAIKEEFCKHLEKQKVSQIFIVTNFERYDNIKQNTFDCIKHLQAFKHQISIVIIISRYQNTTIDIKELEQTLQTDKILIFDLKLTPFQLYKRLSKYLILKQAYLQQLNTENTNMDINRTKTEQNQFANRLEQTILSQVQGKMNYSIHMNDQMQQINQEDKQIGFQMKVQQTNTGQQTKYKMSQ